MNQELAERDLAQANDVSLVPIPAALRDLGVRIAEDATTHSRLVLIPSQVRERVNVIDPVTSLVQADPNWTPRISVAELNPDPDNGPHFYKQAGGKLAPTKQALETLAKAAGVLYTKTARIPRAELDEGEIGYTATVGIRRSDGTVEEIQREKVWVKDAERREIEDAVRNARTKRWQHSDDAEIDKRWLKELKDRSAKTESKAVLRAIRAALQMPHTFTPQDAAKPFLVIGFNFTPDYNDVEVRRMLVAAGLNAQSAFYGGQRELAPAEVLDAETGELTPAEETTPVDAAEPGPPVSDDDPQAVPTEETGPSASVGAAPGDDDEPGADPAPADPETEARLATLGAEEIPNGKRQGQTVAAIVELALAGDEEAAGWLIWALHPKRTWFRAEGDATGVALVEYVRHAAPAIFERAERATAAERGKA